MIEILNPEPLGRRSHPPLPLLTAITVCHQAEASGTSSSSFASVD